MKRLLILLAVLILILPAVSGCARNVDAASKKINIVCTIFPQYDWVRQILGDKADNFEITLLQTGSTDLHSFQPSVGDIVKISDCDLFIGVGGESDEWVADVLSEAVNKNMIVINLLDVLGERAVTEEIKEGMVPEDSEETQNGEEAQDSDETHDGGETPDEHVWLSLKNAEIFCEAIYEFLAKLDTNNSDEFEANLSGYKETLSALNDLYNEELKNKAFDTLLFGDRFPFRYLADDYGLNYYAAFPGCSADTEAGFETIVFLAQKADELNLHTVMVTESSNKSIAELIAGNTAEGKKQILALNSMQSVSKEMADNGVTYMEIMEENLETLKKALR